MSERKCPRCGSDTYTYKDTPCGDHPELKQEYEECHNTDCDYNEPLYEINFNTIEILPPRYERRGDARVSFARTIERDQFGNTVAEHEFECSTLLNYYFEPKPTLMDRFWSLF